jgi:hypothetical protein
MTAGLGAESRGATHEHLTRCSLENADGLRFPTFDRIACGANSPHG